MGQHIWKHCTDSLSFSCVMSADVYEGNAKSAFLAQAKGGRERERVCGCVSVDFRVEMS